MIVEGNHAAIERTFELTPNGAKRTVQKQVAVQTWRDGTIVREVFYHG